MPPQLLLALGIIQVAKQAIPVIQEAFSKGEITKEQQQTLLDEYKALRDNLDAAFSGPGWQIEPDPEPQPVPATDAASSSHTASDV